jgi:large subunit ribosomal protein L25
MAEITVTADTGRPTGSRASGRLRAEGKVPGVVYGLGKDPVAVAVGWRDLRQALTGEAGLNALIDLQVDGDTELVMVKDLQRHPVRRDVLHVDFLRVSRDQELTVEVPIVLLGEATEVLRADGVVDQSMHALTVSAKPQDIPNELTLDVSGLALGDTLRVSDLDLPAGVTTHVDPDDPVVSTSAGAVVEVEPAEATEEGAEEQAAAGGEGEAGAAGDAEATASNADGEGGEGGDAQ